MRIGRPQPTPILTVAFLPPALSAGVVRLSGLLIVIASLLYDPLFTPALNTCKAGLATLRASHWFTADPATLKSAEARIKDVLQTGVEWSIPLSTLLP